MERRKFQISVQQLLAKAKTRQVLTALDEYCRKTNDQDSLKHLILVSSDFYSLEKDFQMKVINYENWRLFVRRINAELLTIINTLSD